MAGFSMCPASASAITKREFSLPFDSITVIELVDVVMVDVVMVDVVMVDVGDLVHGFDGDEYVVVQQTGGC